MSVHASAAACTEPSSKHAVYRCAHGSWPRMVQKGSAQARGLIPPQQEYCHQHRNLSHLSAARRPCSAAGVSFLRRHAHGAGIQAALNGMAAEQWEVRNAASLAFATLVLRTVGVRNAAKVRAAKPLETEDDLFAYDAVLPSVERFHVHRALITLQMETWQDAIFSSNLCSVCLH